MGRETHERRVGASTLTAMQRWELQSRTKPGTWLALNKLWDKGGCETILERAQFLRGREALELLGIDSGRGCFYPRWQNPRG